MAFEEPNILFYFSSSFGMQGAALLGGLLLTLPQK